MEEDFLPPIQNFLMTEYANIWSNLFIPILYWVLVFSGVPWVLVPQPSH